MTLLRAALLTSLALLASTGTFAQEGLALPDDVIQLREMANQAHAREDREAYRSIVAQLHRLRPNNSEYMYQLVLAHAALGELQPAFDVMVRMQRQGLSYDFDQAPDLQKLRRTNLYEYLNDLMTKAGEPKGEAEVLLTLDSELGVVEAIDWDPTRDAFLVGSATSGRLLQVGRNGEFRELLRADKKNGLWGIYDLVVDAERNRLWVSSAATAAFSGFDATDAGRSALFEFELDSLDLVGHYPVPVDGLPHNLGQAALAPNGSLYFADRMLPIIYLKQPGDDRLHPVFAARTLVSLRGIAVSDDGRFVYAADYEMGILRLDVAAGQVSMLGHGETLNLGGIEGLAYVDGDLLIIQSGIRPQRIMRLELNQEGSAVANVVPVAVAQEWFDYPGYGTVVGDELVFFANSQGAAPGREVEPQPIRIARTGIEGLGSIVSPDMERFIEQQARRRMQRPGLEQPTDPKPRQEPPGTEQDGGDR